MPTLTSLLALWLQPFGWTSTFYTTRGRHAASETFIRSSVRPPLLRSLRLVVLLMLTVGGVGLLALSSPTHAFPVLQSSSLASQTTSAHQAGGKLDNTQKCDLGDIGCYANSLATYATEAIWNTITPLVDLAVNNPLNFINQTSPQATYQNSQVRAMVQWELGAVDSALVVFVGFLAYNLIIGHSIGMHLPSFQEAMPRLIVAFLAAHLSLYVCQLLIDFNNALCQGIYETFLKTYLKDTIASMITYGEGGGDGASVVLFGFLLRAWLMIFFFIQLLWLAWQMLVRLAMVALLTALSPLGLMCLALPQTQRWGQMWLSAFTTTVIMQFLQIAALSLGGLLASYAFSAVSTDLGSIPAAMIQQILTLLMSGAVFYLVPRLPHTVQEFALRPVLQAQRSQEVAVQRSIQMVTQEATSRIKRAVATM